MSAEVSVKVTAQNQTKSGFQSALNDAKQFGQQAGAASTPNIDASSLSGKGLRGIFKGLGSDLASASSPAEALQAVVTRIGAAFGKVTSIVGGFAIGRIIAGQMDQIASSVNSGVAAMNSFNAAFEEASNAPTFDKAIEGFNRLGAEIEKVDAAIQELRNNPLDFLTGGNAAGQMEAARDSMVAGQRQAFANSLQSQAITAQEMLATGGDKEQMDEVAKQAKRQKEREQVVSTMSAGPMQKRALADLEKRYSAEDQLDSVMKSNEMDKKRAEYDEQNKKAWEKARADERKRYATESVRNSEEAERMGKSTPELLEIEKKKLERLKREFSAMQPGEYGSYDKALEAQKQGNLVTSLELKSREEAQRASEQATSAASGARPEMVGSTGASAYQRIGFSSGEYFDTRRQLSPEEQAKNLQKISEHTKAVAEALKRGEPLVLNPT